MVCGFIVFAANDPEITYQALAAQMLMYESPAPGHRKFRHRLRRCGRDRVLHRRHPVAIRCFNCFQLGSRCPKMSRSRACRLFGFPLVKARTERPA